MTETNEHPSPAELRKLSTLRDLGDDVIHTLSVQTFVHHAPKGAELLQIGSEDDAILYLLEGTCQLHAEDGAVTMIRHTDNSAKAPLARLRPSHYRVVAKTPVRYLRIAGDLIADSLQPDESHSGLTIENYEVEDEEDLGHMDATNQLTLRLYEDLNTEHLLLPSLPEVAVRIGEAVNSEDADAKRVAKLVENDPAIAVKLIKAANSARFGGFNQVATVNDAVTRLGMQNVRTLVVTFALRELFRTDSKVLKKRMLALWEHSRRIAALTHVLANRIGGFNPHEAMLAGLIHDVGGLAVIGYAREFPEIAEDPIALEASLHAVRGQLSGMMLSKWKLPPELVSAAKDAENWRREHAGKPDYADLVIAAQIHEGVAGGVDPHTVPAIARLGLAINDEHHDLELLNDAEAESEIAAAKQLLAG